ncbi:TlpA family protein disulfide reductase [Pseudoalteromonas sp. S16_S37]|uniref:TlpA family protein disulfide reductase n=1 Tax=Pseudoalteromonas sp. S16_S37 TaxID=2720228 RepID=UPI0016811215|nr:TlpA disulfide reductase family protein [Pseudoalteromonas sp. S16_S37]MBD1582539.1 TlpA family protein disulfide reductase [Pseudoalteromonas sp. S16_S37]
MVKTLLQIVIAVIVFLLFNAYQQRDMLPTSEHQPAPYFSLPQLNSAERISLAAFRGQKVVVYFFAPWCNVCRYSMPNLNKLYEQQQVNAVAIALDYENKAQISAFVADLKLSLPILLGNENIAANYRIRAYPSYYVIDESGNIIQRDMGYSTELGLRLRM